MKDKEFMIDDLGKEVLVDIKKFINHINQFHSSGVSIHEERGHYFTVNDSFRNMLRKRTNSFEQ
tara:strand:- start:576 stop:767 length:192 start_codon:yes stop_codon:yes gene_type:complete